MTTNLTTPNSNTIITNNQPPTTRQCGLNKTGICCKESDTGQSLENSDTVAVLVTVRCSDHKNASCSSSALG